MINDLITTTYMLGLLAIVIMINTILGIIIANKKLEFNWKKLGEGILKAFVIMICVLLFCVCIELVPIVLNRVNITIPEDLITVLQIILVTLTAFTKYAKDCFEKFQIIIGKGDE